MRLSRPILGAAPGLCAIAEGLPARSRTTALACALGASLSGGTTQFVVAAPTAWTGDPLPPAYVLAAAGAAFALPERRTGIDAKEALGARQG